MNKDLINWRALIRLLSGNDQSIRSNSIPIKYQNDISKLKKAIEDWKKTIQKTN